MLKENSLRGLIASFFTISVLLLLFGCTSQQSSSLVRLDSEQSNQKIDNVKLRLKLKSISNGFGLKADFYGYKVDKISLDLLKSGLRIDGTDFDYKSDEGVYPVSFRNVPVGDDYNLMVKRVIDGVVVSQASQSFAIFSNEVIDLNLNMVNVNSLEQAAAVGGFDVSIGVPDPEIIETKEPIKIEVHKSSNSNSSVVNAGSGNAGVGNLLQPSFESFKVIPRSLVIPVSRSDVRVDLEVVVIGFGSSQNLNYKWFVNGVEAKNTSNEQTHLNLEAGNYFVYCEISDPTTGEKITTDTKRFTLTKSEETIERETISEFPHEFIIGDKTSISFGRYLYNYNRKVAETNSGDKSGDFLYGDRFSVGAGEYELKVSSSFKDIFSEVGDTIELHLIKINDDGTDDTVVKRMFTRSELKDGTNGLYLQFNSSGEQNVFELIIGNYSDYGLVVRNRELFKLN